MKRKTERWKPAIDYALRNVDVMDDEQTRLLEDIDADCQVFCNEGMPATDAQALKEKLHQIKDQDLSDEWDTVREMLLPWISHKDLYAQSSQKWEDAFWRDANRRKCPKENEAAFKIGDNVQYAGTIMSANKAYVRARTGKITAINGNEATIKAQDGSTFYCELKGLIRS